MNELALSAAEPFTSPAWGSNFAVFTNSTGAAIPEALVKPYLNRVCKNAKHHRVYLVPERFVLMGYQCMALISPEGKVLGAQRALFLNLKNRVGKRGSELETFDTEYGRIFLCVDADIYHPEVCRYAAGLGAVIIIGSQYMPAEDYGGHMVVSGCWNAAQLNRVYTVAVSGQFNCVCAPLAISARGDGFVCPPGTRLPMTARLHAEKLAAVRKPPAINRKFYAIHRNELVR
jgi:hypothetical protein